MPANFRIVLPNKLYRSGQIAPSEIKSLIASPYNVRRFVSLDQNIGTLIHSFIPQNIEHIMFPLLEGNGSTEGRSLASAIKQGLLDLPATLVHCMQGEDRTGLAIALYRTIKQDWACDRAIEEAKSLGYGRGLPKNTLGQYNIEICRTCKVNHTHYCQIKTTDISQVDDIVNTMRDEFSHQQGWNSAGVIPPGSDNQSTFAPFTGPGSEGVLGAKSGSKARKSILKKIIKFIDEENKLIHEDTNLIALPTSGQIDNYGGSSGGNAPSGTPGSPNSAAFTADPSGLIQL